MAAKGSKIIKKFQMELGSFTHALDYAPGMDYPNIDTEIWSDVAKKSNALSESLLKAKKYATCVERKTSARTTEDIGAGRSVGELFKIIKACRRG
ncbi:unnamed protein product [marine sediment metagenome]|uniref:Uncharacterized protein n=1 Tax=marine sediment metagenome TaxID=412755 RepID=X0Z1P3_9ZZZZ